MNDNPFPVTKKQISIFYGYGRTITVSFLLFALLPLLVVSYITYNQYSEGHKNQTVKRLHDVAHLKKQELTFYFNTILQRLEFESHVQDTVLFIEQLENHYSVSGLPLEKFVKSPEWQSLSALNGRGLENLLGILNYQDVFLISDNGDILFTVKQQEELGVNVLSGRYSSTKFGRSIAATLKNGNITFSGFDTHGLSGQHISGFISVPLIKNNGSRKGVICCQFKADTIEKILENDAGNMIETYLVNHDLTLRSGFAYKTAASALKWQKKRSNVHQHSKKESDNREDRGVFEYVNDRGIRVLCKHIDLSIAGINYAVVTEINLNEGLSDLRKFKHFMYTLIALTCVLVLIFAFIMVKRIVQPVLELSSSAGKVAAGDLSTLIVLKGNNEFTELADIFNRMILFLKHNQKENQLKNWFQTGHMDLNSLMNMCQDIPELTREVTAFLAGYLGAHMGAFYICSNEKRTIRLAGSYSFSTRKYFKNEFAYDEGIIGQAVQEKKTKLLTVVPEDYISVSSGLGEAVPNHIIIKPFVLDDTVLGVLELGTLDEFGNKESELLDYISESVALNIQKIQSHIRVQFLLIKSQQQTEALEQRQKELKLTNIKLEEQTEALTLSEDNLKKQQEALKDTNLALSQKSEELIKQTEQLETQKNQLNQNNEALKKAKADVEEKAREVTSALKHKSEFLANMSHELRTPLNSILLLSSHLIENRDKNLSSTQIECAQTVHSSGNELLSLINEVLDFAQVESGKMNIVAEEIDIQDIQNAMQRIFEPVAIEKGLLFDIIIEENVPRLIRTDGHCLSQIIKNLLSNAFKFTEKGTVTFSVNYNNQSSTLIFSVEDTGPGIPEKNQQDIFNAFIQADGSTSRKFGGTGLGLSISQEFAEALGGGIRLISAEGKGSIFCFELPLDLALSEREHSELYIEPLREIIKETTEQEETQSKLHFESTISGATEGVVEKHLADDRNNVIESDKTLLIIEDEKPFARFLRNYARQRGFKVLVAASGSEGLSLAGTLNPDVVILEVGLPDMCGHTVVLRLKEALSTRRMPVFVISSVKTEHTMFRTGVIGHEMKPANQAVLEKVFHTIERVVSDTVKKLLIIEEDLNTQNVLRELLEGNNLEITVVNNGAEAKIAIDQNNYHCILLDLMLHDITGEEVLKNIVNTHGVYLPVIVYTARELSASEQTLIDRIPGGVIHKTVGSRGKVLDEVCKYLHRHEMDVSKKSKELLETYHEQDRVIENSKVLLVDDDMRNVFSLISVLEGMGISTLVAKNSEEAIEALQKNLDTNLVLVDITMPVMDDFESIKEIRKCASEGVRTIPIIALTAKALKGDRAKCLAAGANDYMVKPVSAETLLPIIRVWISHHLFRTGKIGVE